MLPAENCYQPGKHELTVTAMTSTSHSACGLPLPSPGVGLSVAFLSSLIANIHAHAVC